MKDHQNYYAVTDVKILQPFLHHRLTAMSMHWVCQNMQNMDVTELSFKLAIDIVLTTLFTLILAGWLPLLAAVGIGFILAHTLNFLLNGQIFVVLKHFGDIHHELSEYDAYIEAIKRRLEKVPSIRWAAIYGSMARGELKTTSDLDIRLIRYPGFIHGLKSCWFVLRERTRAHLNRFPIDFLLLDSPRLLKRLRPDEPPIVIDDKDLVSFNWSKPGF